MHKLHRTRSIFICLGIIILIFTSSNFVYAQRQWLNVDSLFQPLPSNVHVYRSDEKLNGKPFIAYYLEAPLNDRNLDFTTDTSDQRRLTPREFFSKNNKPLLVVNATFFSFETNKNLNLVINQGRLKSYNVTSNRSKGKDSMTAFVHPFASAIGITKTRKADISWTHTDSTRRMAFASQSPIKAFKDSSYFVRMKYAKHKFHLQKWKMQTAIGGGPVLVQKENEFITNEEERKFTGKAINDKHPRTLMGYTKEGKLIIMAIQGRFDGIAEGASLKDCSNLMIELKCEEAMNLDGGGSSCMLINGKETITPSDKQGQRPVPAVFQIWQKH